MRRLYLSTMITEFVTLTGQLIAYKFAASYLGKEGFSEYALARRTLALLLPAVLLGLGVAIPRYIALSAGETARHNRSSYFVAGLLVLAASLAIGLTLLNVFKRPAAFLFFGNARYSYLVAPLSLMMFGLGLHSACYGYFRGSLDMTKANLLQFTNHGVVPLVVFPLFRRSTSSVLTGLGSFWALISLVALLSTRLEKSSGDIAPCAKELLGYGLGRVPADFIQLAFLTLPATFTAHIYGVTQAGFVAFGTSLLTMVASLFFPIGSVLLPEASQMVGQGDFRALERRTLQVLSASSLISIIIIVGTLLFARPIFTLYLGRSYVDVVGIVRVMALGALPYTIYTSLKNVVDASSERAVNSKNMLIAFGVFVGACSSIYFGLHGPLYIPFFVVICLYILGSLTLLEIRKIFTASRVGTAAQFRDTEKRKTYVTPWFADS